VIYVTERAVFELQDDGLVMTEIARGVDLERDVLQQMGFRPRIADPLKNMDARLFGGGTMGLELTDRRTTMEPVR
jgi:propionate CoA-transferase